MRNPTVPVGQEPDLKPPPGPFNLPIRQKSAHGEPPPSSKFLRGCAKCGAGFNELEGGAGERGLWTDCWKWYCSQECFDD